MRHHESSTRVIYMSHHGVVTQQWSQPALHQTVKQTVPDTASIHKTE